MPVVLVDRGHERIPSITIDDVEGGRMAAEHLLALGHRRIAFLGDEEENRVRLRFERATARGVRGGSGGRRIPARSGAAHSPACTAATSLTMPLPGCWRSQDPPTAIFATSDVQAIGVLKAARAEGVSVPDELSVLGFDDVEAAEYTGLTTIAQPLEESGALGAELLLRSDVRRARGGSPNCRSRSSTGARRAPFRRRSAGEGKQRKHELKSGIRRRRVHA